LFGSISINLEQFSIASSGGTTWKHFNLTFVISIAKDIEKMGASLSKQKLGHELEILFADESHFSNECIIQQKSINPLKDSMRS
jgi:hypothetical protein